MPPSIDPSQSAIERVVQEVTTMFPAGLKTSSAELFLHFDLRRIDERRCQVERLKTSNNQPERTS
jgi:hypothetical protein